MPISGGMGPKILLSLSPNTSRLLERLPIELGNFPWKLFLDRYSLVNLEQFDSEEIKPQSPASSMLYDRSSSSKFGNDQKNGMGPVSLFPPR